MSGHTGVGGGAGRRLRSHVGGILAAFRVRWTGSLHCVCCWASEDERREHRDARSPFESARGGVSKLHTVFCFRFFYPRLLPSEIHPQEMALLGDACVNGLRYVPPYERLTVHWPKDRHEGSTLAFALADMFGGRSEDADGEECGAEEGPARMHALELSACSHHSLPGSGDPSSAAVAYWEAECSAGRVELKLRRLSRDHPEQQWEPAAASETLSRGCQLRIRRHVHERVSSAELPVVLHEDEAMLIVRKPAGLSSTQDGADDRASLIGVMRRLRKELTTLRLAHRLDIGTSGVIVLAKGGANARRLMAVIGDRHVIKTYVARVARGSCAAVGESIQVDQPLRFHSRRGVAEVMPSHATRRVVRDATRRRVRPLQAERDARARCRWFRWPTAARRAEQTSPCSAALTTGRPSCAASCTVADATRSGRTSRGWARPLPTMLHTVGARPKIQAPASTATTRRGRSERCWAPTPCRGAQSAAGAARCSTAPLTRRSRPRPSGCTPTHSSFSRAHRMPPLPPPDLLRLSFPPGRGYRRGGEASAPPGRGSTAATAIATVEHRVAAQDAGAAVRAGR